MSDDIKDLFRYPGALKQFTDWAAEDIFSGLQEYAASRNAANAPQPAANQPATAGTIKNEDSFSNFLFGGAREKSQEAPQRQSVQPGNPERTECICPSCGHRKPHTPGKRCVEEKCPSCGHRMMGTNK